MLVAFANENPPKLFDVPLVVAANLKQLDIALGQMGELLAAIIGLIRELERGSTKKELHDLAVLARKIEQTWELYVLLEETIASFPVIHRAIYYGPFRQPEWSRQPFLETPRGKAFVARTTGVFESFLVHIESVLSAILRTMSQRRFGPPEWILKCKSIGQLTSLRQGEPERFAATTESDSLGAIESIAEHFGALEEIRAYRNFVVHQGTIPLRGTVVRTPSGYLDGQVSGSRIRRVRSRVWKFSEKATGWPEDFDVALFSRYALWRMLTVTEIALSRLLGKVPGRFPR